MIQINKSKNKKQKLQFRVVNVSDHNGKPTGSETKLDTRQGAFKNIVANMKLYNSAGAVYVQDNTGKQVAYYVLYDNGAKMKLPSKPQVKKSPHEL